MAGNPRTSDAVEISTADRLRKRETAFAKTVYFRTSDKLGHAYSAKATRNNSSLPSGAVFQKWTEATKTTAFEQNLLRHEPRTQQDWARLVMLAD